MGAQEVALCNDVQMRTAGRPVAAASCPRPRAGSSAVVRATGVVLAGLALAAGSGAGPGLVGAGSGPAAGAVPAAASTSASGALSAASGVHEVRLTGQGPVPVHVQAAPGESVRFVNDDSFVHRVVGDTVGWRFDTGTLVPGSTATVPTALPGPGTYGFRLTGLDRVIGTVTVPSSSTSPSPSASAGAASPDPSSPGPSSSPRAYPASSTGSAPAPSAAPSAVPSAVVRPVPRSPSGAELPGVTQRSTPPGSPPLLAARPTVVPEARALRSPVPARPYGLPVAIAVVLLLGVVWLLVRLLLAELLPRPRSDGGPHKGTPPG